MKSPRLLLSGLVANALVACASLLVACAIGPVEPLSLGQEASTRPPIVFVHGNGDTAALWQTTIWRFESNGWPRSRLHAIEVPYPFARDDNNQEQPGSTSTAENRDYLKREVAQVLKTTGASKVVLFGNSRGGYAIRDYIQNGGGAATVSMAILSGVPNHGVWSIKNFREGNEFAGTGPFLTQLNAAKDAAGDEVVGPVKWLTIRSDNNDKYAQPTDLWIGAHGTATHVSYDGPELKGATNVVIPHIDHRETAYSPAAFSAAFAFITGKLPKTTDIRRENAIILSGKITGRGLNSLEAQSGNYSNNLPIPGATLEIYATDDAGIRRGGPVLQSTVGKDGQWGPLHAGAGVHYEFVMDAPGYATTHLYRSPFPRSSDIVNLRPERLNEAERKVQSVVTLFRPRGYFDRQRDKIVFDGQTLLPGVPAVGAGVASSKLLITEGGNRAISGEFNGEHITGRTWPVVDNNAVVLEITQ